jgi:MFS family permease
MLEVLGAFGTGVFLAIFRLYVSPYALMAVYSFFMLGSQVLMFFIAYSSICDMVAFMVAGFVSGGFFTLMGIIANEEFGAKSYAKVLGFFMTGASLGIFIYDYLVFDVMYSKYTSDSGLGRSYGKWNMYIFIVSTFSCGLAFLMSLFTYLATRGRDADKMKDKIKDFINF